MSTRRVKFPGVSWTVGTDHVYRPRYILFRDVLLALLPFASLHPLPPCRLLRGQWFHFCKRFM